MVDVEPVPAGQLELVREIVQKHVRHTDSAVGQALLDDWSAASRRFSVLVPRDYRRVLEATERARANGEDVDVAVMTAAAAG
jgi:glutamate synthase (NADPH/NADH) large chain